VTVDAENLLQHQQGAARALRGRREPGLKLVAIASHDGGEFAHGMAF